MRSPIRLLAAMLITGLACSMAAAQSQMLFPATGATNVCPDTTLRVAFGGPLKLGTAGKIQIFDASNNSVVDMIDIARSAPPAPGVSVLPADRAAPTLIRSVGGLNNYHYYPVLISGSEAQIFPAPGKLEYNKSYYVTIEAGVFTDDKGISGDSTWRFTTKAAAPAKGATKITVAADNSGDFATVQGAIDSIPDGSTTPTTIFIKKGTYTELIYFSNKHGLTFQGEDRKQTVIEYATNDRFNNSAGGGGYRRGVFRANRCNDLTLTNLTIRNTSAYGASQAEAIIFNGPLTAHAVVTKVDLYSYQDTFQINGQAYISDTYIEGDVDFMWGTGPCYFENCEAKSLNSGRYYTQIRNRETNHGYVYYKCIFSGAQGIMGNFLSRIAPRTFPASEVVLIDCVLTTAVSPVAWRFDDPSEGPNVHFWEFNSHTPDGKPIDASQRMTASKQLSKTDDAKTIENYSSAKWVLGGEWEPKQAAVFQVPQAAGGGASPAGTLTISAQPASQMALLGTSPIFSVAATGSGEVKYQWYKDGHAIHGATSDMLQVPNATWFDAAMYTVTVTSGSSSVTSDSVTLTMVAPATAAPGSKPPQLPTIPARVFDVTANGVKGDGSTDNTAAIQKTLEAALAAGGGIVRFPAAAKPYLSGPIKIGSNIDFHLDSGAVLQALPFSKEAKPGAYPLAGASYANFVTADNAHDIALSGNGTINGDGAAWWQAFRSDPRMPHRPYMIRFNGCSNVLVTGLNFTNSPMFHVAMSAMNNLTVFGVHISAPAAAPNTDGIDPSGQHMLFQNLYVSVDDDHLVMKPGGAFCSDIMVADCLFGRGHGLSVGGQSNRGLDGMTVRNIVFNGTETGLRLKADPTQGGEVKNISYSNIVMYDVDYPVVFYSYYRSVGNPGSTEGGNQTTVEKVKAWNAKPPNALATNTMPSWKNITISNLNALNTKKHPIIFGLPLENYFIDNVKLNNVKIPDGPGLLLYDATNIQFTGDTKIGKVITCNALAITGQPQNQTASAGGNATFTVATAGTSGVNDKAPTFQWRFKGDALMDGKTADGATISGATSAILTIGNVQAAQAGKYDVIVSNNLDSYDTKAGALVPDKAPVSANSAEATLAVQ